jgi:hypothetical protein
MMKTMFRLAFIFVLVSLVFTPATRIAGSGPLTQYKIDEDTQGGIETVNNIVNTVVVSNDPNIYKAEYEAGFIQGKLQKDSMIAARDNVWDMLYLIDPSHSYPKQIPPLQDELLLAQKTLAQNYQYTVDYISKQGSSDVGLKMRRLLYRLVGIYHGAVKDKPEALTFDEKWLPAFSEAEMAVGYETASLTFMDVYFINTFGDLGDVMPAVVKEGKPSKCSAFVKRTANDIYLTHNSWFGYLDQSQALTLWINGDYMTVNIVAPGLLGSDSDFGYTNKGLIFNETTHRATYSEPKVEALWMFWRSVLAEQFATSLDEFFKYVSLEASGTYMNGYMLVDVKTKGIGLVEMSYKSFIFFKPDGSQDGYTVITKPEGLDKTYDKELVQPDYLLGINYPASQQIRDDLKAQDNRPARRRQFLEQIGSVKDIETAKALIVYTDPKNPLSIYGRWDLGYGETPAPKTVPDGSIDAKAVSASMIQYAFDLKGIFDPSSTLKTFWMKFGTPNIDGKPFIWSESQWKDWKLRQVPDRVDGEYTLLNAYMK